MSSRANFSKKTKRQAWERSQCRCEGVGKWYGLEPGKRCNADLSKGVEYDHIDLDANSKDNSLSNCAAVCSACHDIKTRLRDIPIAAKTQRQQDKARGITGRKRKMNSRPFEKTEKRQQIDKSVLPPLSPIQLYRERT